MRQFVVMKEEYTRGPGGEITVQAYQAATLSDLAILLDPDIAKDYEDAPEERNYWDELCGMNGDGYDYYLIKEATIVDGVITLEEIPMDGSE